MNAPIETRPTEVIAIASKIIALISESVSCSDEVLAAALKVCATTVEESRTAQFAAQMRAGMMNQYGGKR